MQTQARMIQRLHEHKPSQLTSSKRAVTQLLTLGTVYKNSDNQLYRTYKNNDNYVGVKAGAAAPQPATWITPNGTVTSGFHEYQFTAATFINDCLQFAKRLGYEIQGLPLQQHHRLKAVIGGIPGNVSFAVRNVSGTGSTANDLADATHGAFAQNENADPGIGQSYTTVPQTAHMASAAGCRFHVATVVAKDGSDTVTCEADAGDHGRAEPVFDMYPADPTSAINFHTTYANAYGGAYAVTGILQPG
jgi:hypothetical protein